MIRMYFIVGTILMLWGCADSVDYQNVASMEPVGFWYGLWHGFIIIWSFVGSLISDDIAIYTAYNNGGWYDLGFVCGIITLILVYAANDD